jgi:hypothetical protein
MPLKFLWLFVFGAGSITGAFGLVCYQQPVRFTGIMICAMVLGHAVDCIIASNKKE